MSKKQSDKQEVFGTFRVGKVSAHRRLGNVYQVPGDNLPVRLEQMIVEVVGDSPLVLINWLAVPDLRRNGPCCARREQ